MHSRLIKGRQDPTDNSTAVVGRRGGSWRGRRGDRVGGSWLDVDGRQGALGTGVLTPSSGGGAGTGSSSRVEDRGDDGGTLGLEEGSEDCHQLYVSRDGEGELHLHQWT